MCYKGRKSKVSLSGFSNEELLEIHSVIMAKQEVFETFFIDLIVDEMQERGLPNASSGNRASVKQEYS